MADSGQTYANHTRFFPLFHFFVLPVLLINALLSAWRIVQTPTLGAVWTCLVAFAIAGGALAARVMAITVQDRVIRLEMRLRMRAVLPADLQPRINDLTPAQLVGLRFACDSELPDLVRKVLAGSLKSTRDIKQNVKEWQGDYLRA